MRKNRAIVYIMMWICCSIVTAISIATVKQYYCLTTMVVPLVFMIMDYMLFGDGE